MYIWNKVLVGLILLVSVGFFFLAARALKTHRAWQESYEKHLAALENVSKERGNLLRDISELKLAVHRYTVDRGRVWPFSQPQQFDPATGSVTVQVAVPPPANAVNLQLHAFEEPSAAKPAGQYLGEFTVKAVDAQNPQNMRMQLQVTRVLNDERRAKIAQSGKAKWSLYETMPKYVPNYVEELETAKPADAAAGGTAGTPDGPTPSTVATEASPRDAAAKPEPAVKPQLPYLANYESLFNDLYRRRTELEDLKASTEKDIEALQTANKQAAERIGLMTKEIAALATEKSKSEIARDAMGGHLKAIQAKMAELQSAIEQTQKANQAAVAEIARIQIEATRRIDARTREMAQTGAAVALS